MSKIKKGLLMVAAGAAIAIVAGTGGAYASGLIHGSDIANGTITYKNLAHNTITEGKIASGAVGVHELTQGTRDYIKGYAGYNIRAKRGPQGATGATGAVGPQGPAGANGTNGKDGRDGLAGAVFRVENYENGGGGSATVACADDDATSQQYTAIAGGVQGSTVNDQGTNGFRVTSSFPGRMDWSTNTPKPDRLDGWIILGNGVRTSTLKVWALCVPTTSIAVQTVNLDN